MKRCFYERGRNIGSPPENVAALWSNWEIYDALLGRRFQIQRIADDSWTADYYLRVRARLVVRRAGLSEGCFIYEALSSFWGLPGSTLVTLRYSELPGGNTNVYGSFSAEMSPIVALVERAFRGRIHRIADAVIAGGQETCEMLARKDKAARSRLSPAMEAVVDEYAEHAQKLRLGHFRSHLLGTDEVGPLSIAVDARASARLQSVEGRLFAIEKRMGALAGDIRSAIGVSYLDIGSGLTKNRSIAENISLRLLAEAVGKPLGSGKPPDFSTAINQLRRMGAAPEIVLARLSAVRELGNVGAHIAGDAARDLRAEDFDSSLSALMFVVEWYFSPDREEGGPTEL